LPEQQASSAKFQKSPLSEFANNGKIPLPHRRNAILKESVANATSICSSKEAAVLSLAPANCLRRHDLIGCLAAFFILLPALGCGSKDGATPTASIREGSYNSSTSSFLEKPKLDLHPVVKVHTSAGDFTLTLDAEHAPLTVDNFLAYMKAGHYNGTIFHQLFDGFIVLGGGYDAQFNLRPTEPPVRNEAHNGLKNRRGTIAMARPAEAIDSATSQFFINLADNRTLDFAGYEPDEYGYCVFGEVTEGMDSIERIAKSKITKSHELNNAPEQPVVIESMQLAR
jgi:cyclophilin family peptidyl-prolyl cis-trans isomerase